MTNKILRFKQVQQIIPLSRSSIWRRTKKDTFPKPISLGGNAVGWLEKDITEWIESQVKTAAESRS